MTDSTPRSWYRAPHTATPEQPNVAPMQTPSFSSLDSLAHHLSNTPICALQKTDPRCFIGTGATSARVVFVAQAPTADDIRALKPFSGIFGALLDAMLLSIGLDRTSCYLTYSVFWRPPGQRSPAPAELSACRPYLLNIITLVRPIVVVALGSDAQQALLGHDSKRTDSVAPWQTLSISDSYTVKVLPSLDLEDLDRTPLKKRRAFADLLLLRDALGDL